MFFWVVSQGVQAFLEQTLMYLHISLAFNKHSNWTNLSTEASLCAHVSVVAWASDTGQVILFATVLFKNIYIKSCCFTILYDVGKLT